MAYKYNVDEANRRIECFSSFAKKPVRGIAKCDPGDTFDVESGKKLAKLRCDLKVSIKRKKKAHSNYAQALKDFEAARERLDIASAYVVDATLEADNALITLKKYELTLK